MTKKELLKELEGFSKKDLLEILLQANIQMEEVLEYLGEVGEAQFDHYRSKVNKLKLILLKSNNVTTEIGELK